MFACCVVTATKEGYQGEASETKSKVHKILTREKVTVYRCCNRCGAFIYLVLRLQDASTTRYHTKQKKYLISNGKLSSTDSKF